MTKLPDASKTTEARICQSHTGRGFGITPLVLLALVGFAEAAQPNSSAHKTSVSVSDTLHVPAFELPMSPYMSEQAKAALKAQIARDKSDTSGAILSSSIPTDMATARRMYRAVRAPSLATIRERYAV